MNCGHVSHPQLPPFTNHSPNQTLSYFPVYFCVYTVLWVYLALLAWTHVEYYLLVHGQLIRAFATEESGTCTPER